MAKNINYIYSTLAADQNIPLWADTPSGKQIVKSVLIKGGAQLANYAGIGFETPLGIVTRIDDDELAILNESHAFKHWLDKGFMRLETVREDIDKVVSGSMQLPTSKEGAPLSESEITGMETQQGIEIKVKD